MAHEYSIKIHDYLTGKIADAQKNKKKAKSLEDFGNVQFYNGQLEELFSVRKYLTDQIDLDTHKYYNWCIKRNKMAYIYLLNLHEKIDKKLIEAKKSVDTASNEPEKIKFIQGRIQVLSEFKEFLNNNLNSKLPRKIRQRLKENQ